MAWNQAHLAACGREAERAAEQRALADRLDEAPRREYCKTLQEITKCGNMCALKTNYGKMYGDLDEEPRHGTEVGPASGNVIWYDIIV